MSFFKKLEKVLSKKSECVKTYDAEFLNMLFIIYLKRMKTFDIIYIAMWCFVGAVILWAYLAPEGKTAFYSNPFERFKHFIFQYEKGVVYRGGNKKKRRKRKTV